MCLESNADVLMALRADTCALRDEQPHNPCRCRPSALASAGTLESHAPAFAAQMFEREPAAASGTSKRSRR